MMALVAFSISFLWFASSFCIQVRVFLFTWVGAIYTTISKGVRLHQHYHSTAAKSQCAGDDVIFHLLHMLYLSKIDEKFSTLCNHFLFFPQEDTIRL